jgi:hypothetical protein
MGTYSIAGTSNTRRCEQMLAAKFVLLVLVAAVRAEANSDIATVT